MLPKPLLPKPPERILAILRRRFDIAKGAKRVSQKARFSYTVRKEPTGTKPLYRAYAFDRDTGEDLTKAVSSVGFSPRGQLRKVKNDSRWIKLERKAGKAIAALHAGAGRSDTPPTPDKVKHGTT